MFSASRLTVAALVLAAPAAAGSAAATPNTPVADFCTSPTVDLARLPHTADAVAGWFACRTRSDRSGGVAWQPPKSPPAVSSPCGIDHRTLPRTADGAQGWLDSLR